MPTSIEELVMAWPKASEIQREHALNVLNGTIPAFAKLAAYDPEPFVNLARVAKSVGFHSSSLIRKGVHKIGHFSMGTASGDLRYKISEVVEWLDTGCKPPAKPGPSSKPAPQPRAPGGKFVAA